ncbi:MAG: response regulator [Parvibaculum sp.]|uniref:response regulator n=1 Tax=Parvibaculum sp. TaxID=2024848 RepID=UPI0025DE069B|nr:response regulator [Parvibaculum sp.]MCE9648270.1 response regulator [Parvibaculum sp.]
MTSSPSSRQTELFARLKVLVVDDSVEMRRLLVALLNVMGIGEVICAPDGDTGLRLYAERNPDLVITDGTMQPMDGYEMTRAIRAMRKADDTPDRGAEVPVLMLSGHTGPEIIARARDEGVTDYIVKPVTPELLYERVMEAVSKPVHLVETPTWRGPSPTRRLTIRSAE